MPDTGPSQGFLSKIFGKKKRTEDIELPNESGRRDKRLPKPKEKSNGIIENFKTMKERINPMDRAAKIMGSSVEEHKKKSRGPLYSDEEVSPGLVKNRDFYRNRNKKK